MNVHFSNFDVSDLVSKGAKARLKKFLKNEINSDDDTKLIKNQLNDCTNHLISKFFKKEEGFNFDIKYLVKGQDIFLSLEKLTNQELEKNEKRQKLKDKIKSEKNKRFELRNRKLFMKSEKNNTKLLSSDNRVTQNMIKSYNIAKSKFGNELPNPIEILDNKDLHIKKFVEYISTVMKNTKTDKELHLILDNEYSSYMAIVTGIDYKKLLQMFKAKIESEKADDNFENLDHHCDDENCGHNKEVIPDNLTKEMVDSDENIEEEINSD